MIRYKATIRSTPLSVTPTYLLNLRFPARIAGATSQLCLHPTAIRIGYSGVPYDPTESVAIPRHLLLDPHQLPATIKALLQLMEKQATSCAEQQAASAILLALLGQAKGVGQIIFSRASPLLLMTGILGSVRPDASALPQLVSKAMATLSRSVRDMSTEVAFKTCLDMIPLLARRALSVGHIDLFFATMGSLCGTAGRRRSAQVGRSRAKEERALSGSGGLLF